MHKRNGKEGTEEHRCLGQYATYLQSTIHPNLRISEAINRPGGFEFKPRQCVEALDVHKPESINVSAHTKGSKLRRTTGRGGGSLTEFTRPSKGSCIRTRRKAREGGDGVSSKAKGCVTIWLHLPAIFSDRQLDVRRLFPTSISPSVQPLALLLWFSFG
jgi:hypothetical protein